MKDFPAFMMHSIGTDGIHQNRFCRRCYITESPEMLMQPCLKNFPNRTRERVLEVIRLVDQSIDAQTESISVYQQILQDMFTGVPKVFASGHLDALITRRNESVRTRNAMGELFGIDAIPEPKDERIKDESPDK